MNTGKRFVFFFTASKIRGCWGAISKGRGGGWRSTQMEVWHEGRHKIRQRFIPDLGLKCWLIKSSVSSPVNLHPYYFLLCYNVQSLVIMLNSSYWIIFAIWFGFERESKCRMYAYLHYYLAQFILQWEACDKNTLKVTFHVRPTHPGDDKCHIPALWCKVCPICLTN